MKDMKISTTALRKLKRNNAHVADYLDAYRRMGKVDFAVMIAGPWGSVNTKVWDGCRCKDEYAVKSPSVFQEKMLAAILRL